MSKKSNNKGYFLAETIVVIALVTSVMAYVFPNVTKVYDNYNNRSKYYDQTEDVYLLKAIAEYYEDLTGGLNSSKGNVTNISYMGYLTYDNSVEGFDLNTYPDNTGSGCLNYGNDLQRVTTSYSNAHGAGEFKALNIPRDDWGNINGTITIGNKITPINFIESTDYQTTDGYKLSELYITGYLSTPSSSDYNFNKYLNRLKKNTSDSSSYRLIGVFKKGNSVRYASIKVDNPNPKRNCNLGGS